MATIASAAYLTQKMIDEAVDWYIQTRVPRRFVGAHPLVLARAKAIAGGNWQRCVLDEDGSITIYNHPQWTPSHE